MAVEERKTLSVDRQVSAPAKVLWEMISDVTRMGQWSPETTSCKWLGKAGGPAIGARFRGSNVNGKFKWGTTCTVTDCEAGSTFAFESKSLGLRISRWEYRFEAAGNGCRVTESWKDQRGMLVKIFSPKVSGVKDRFVHNERTMRQTLDNLAHAAEAD